MTFNLKSLWKALVAIACISLMIDAWDIHLGDLPTWRIVSGFVFMVIAMTYFSDVAYEEDKAKESQAAEK